MTAVQTESAWTISRERWFAQVHDGFVIVYLSPDADVHWAIVSLIPAERRHMWVAEAQDFEGDLEIWVLTRE